MSKITVRLSVTPVRNDSWVADLEKTYTGPIVRFGPDADVSRLRADAQDFADEHDLEIK